MPRVLRYEATPNPDALKLVLDAPVSDRPRSFLTAADAAGDPIAGPLFATGGVRAVLMNSTWMTVNKRPDADWRTIKPLAERLLAQHA